MSVPCVIASYVLCDVVFFVVILCLLLILAKNENKKKELSVFLPLSRLFMIALLAMTFCWTGVPSAGYERIAVFVVVSLGMLLPLIVGPALKKVAGRLAPLLILHAWVYLRHWVFSLSIWGLVTGVGRLPCKLRCLLQVLRGRSVFF